MCFADQSWVGTAAASPCSLNLLLGSPWPPARRRAGRLAIDQILGRNTHQPWCLSCLTSATTSSVSSSGSLLPLPCYFVLEFSFNLETCNPAASSYICWLQLVVSLIYCYSQCSASPLCCQRAMVGVSISNRCHLFYHDPKSCSGTSCRAFSYNVLITSCSWSPTCVCVP